MNDDFPTTHWSLVLSAQGPTEASSRRAMAALCESYWYPLYAYVRRRGHSPEDARDLVQGYFVQLLERHMLDVVVPEKGRFRAFLLHTIKHHLINEGERARAQKRGGGATPLSLDVDHAEVLYARAVVSERTPELEFDKSWAETLVARVLDRLADEARGKNRLAEFERMRPLLTEGEPRGAYRKLAEELGKGEGAVRTAVHRLRRRFGELLRREIAHTVADPDQVDDEVRHLLNVLAG